MKPDATLEKFISVFNAGFPDKEDITVDDVEYSYTTAYFAKCGPRSNGNEVFFARNKDWWNKHDTKARIGLLIHEISHYNETSHQPEFYEEMITRFNNVKENIVYVKDAFDTEISMSDVANWLVDDIGSHQVDSRKQTLYDVRKKVSDQIGYEYSDEEAFNSMRINIHNNRKKVHIDNTVLSRDLSRDAVSDWLRYPRKDYVYINEYGNYCIKPILSEKNDTTDKYYPKTKDGEYAYALARLNANVDYIPYTLV